MTILLIAALCGSSGGIVAAAFISPAFNEWLGI